MGRHKKAPGDGTAMERLDNPEENPCFGCGPANPRGLGLTMVREDHEGQEVVRTEHTPTSEEIGWPGFVHGGLHFLLLYDVSYWAALELGGNLMTARGPMTFDQPVTPRIGRSVVARAWIEEATDDEFAVVAESRGGDRLLGRLESAWSPVSRERLEAAGVDLPDYLWEEMRP